MAKLRGAKKAAFLRRMAAGRRKHSRRAHRAAHGRRRRRPSRSHYASARRAPRRLRFTRNPAAIIANPGWYPANYGDDSVSRRRKRRRKRGTSMAKRRKTRRRARRAAPRRRKRSYARRPSRRRRRRHTHWGHVSGHNRRVNPRRRRRRRGRARRRLHARRRRNPGFGGGIVKAVLKPYIAGLLAGGVGAVVDAGLANYPVLSKLSKLGLAFLVAFGGRRRYPVATIAAIGALAGTQGYQLGTKLAGGLVAHNPSQAVKGLGEMSQTYPEMGALLQGGVGALLAGMGGPSDVPMVARDYTTALANMTGDDD